MDTQGEYCLRYGAVGTRVALVASEPITRQAGDWVAVPRNTALIIISEKVGNRPSHACLILFVPSFNIARSWGVLRCILPISLHHIVRQRFEGQARML